MVRRKIDSVDWINAPINNGACSSKMQAGLSGENAVFFPEIVERCGIAASPAPWWLVCLIYSIITVNDWPFKTSAGGMRTISHFDSSIYRRDSG